MLTGLILSVVASGSSVLGDRCYGWDGFHNPTEHISLTTKWLKPGGSRLVVRWRQVSWEVAAGSNSDVGCCVSFTHRVLVFPQTDRLLCKSFLGKTLWIAPLPTSGDPGGITTAGNQVVYTVGVVQNPGWIGVKDDNDNLGPADAMVCRDLITGRLRWKKPVEEAGVPIAAMGGDRFLAIQVPSPRRNLGKSDCPYRLVVYRTTDGAALARFAVPDAARLKIKRYEYGLRCTSIDRVGDWVRYRFATTFLAEKGVKPTLVVEIDRAAKRVRFPGLPKTVVGKWVDSQIAPTPFAVRPSPFPSQHR